MEKVTISKCEEEHNQNWCGRCDKYFCVECVTMHTVDLGIVENIHSDRDDLEPMYQNWEGEDVCPWCYNQLVDKKNETK